MLESILTYIIGLIGGIGVGIQTPLGGVMSGRVGPAASSLIVHLSGAVLSLALLVARRGENIGDWRALPPYMFLLGLFGVLIMVTVSHTLPRVGAGVAVTLIILGQLIAGMIIDHFGFFSAARPIDLTRVIAAVLLAIGGYLMVK